MRICLEVLWMRGVGRLQVHEIRSYRLLYKEVFEVLSNFKKSYFWWFGDPTCGDSTGGNRIEKDQGRVCARLFPGSGKTGQFDLVHVERLQVILANGGYVDVLFTYGECGFHSLDSWSYFKEWVWNLGT